MTYALTHRHRGSECRGGPEKVGRLKEQVKNTEREYLDFEEEKHLVKWAKQPGLVRVSRSHQLRQFRLDNSLL